MDALDYKITTKTYPTTNNGSALEFNLKKNPNLFLRKDKIIIRGEIKVGEKYVVENGFAVKLFNKLTVEVDSFDVSNNRVE